MKRALFLFLISSVISGCASLPRQTFNSGVNSHIKNIGVITPPPVEQVPVRMRTHPAAGGGGLLGALIAEADMSSKTTKYNDALKSTKTDWPLLSRQKIIQALQNVGYSADVLNIRSKDAEEYLSSYPTTTADAVLDYVIHPAQVAAGATTNYVPTVAIDVRLVDPKTKSILYEEHLVSGLPTLNYSLMLPSNKEYNDIDALVTHAEESENELKEGVNKIANRIALDLRK